MEAGGCNGCCLLTAAVGTQPGCSTTVVHLTGGLEKYATGVEARTKKIGVQGKSSTGRSWFTVSSSFRVDGNNWRGLFLNNFVQPFFLHQCKPD